MTSIVDGHRGSWTPRRQRRRLEVPETEAEQDQAIRAAAEVEFE